jgi:hypothetical protein
MARKVNITYQGKDQLTPTTKKVNKGLAEQNEITKELDASMLSLEGVMGKIGGTATLVVGGIVAVSAAVWKLTISAADAGDAIFDMSRRFGISAEAVSELKFVAEQSGTSMNTLGNAIAKLSKNAIKGGEAFDKWNVETKNFDGTLKSSEDLFLSSVRAIERLGSQVEKTAAAQELFGGGGKELLQVLLLGESGIDSLRQRHQELGNVITSEGAAAANIFNNRLGELNDSLSAITREMGDELIPAMTQGVRVLTDIITWTRELIKEDSSLLDILTPLKAAWDLSNEALTPLIESMGLLDRVNDEVASSLAATAEQQRVSAAASKENTEALRQQETVTKRLASLQDKWRKQALRQAEKLARERELIMIDEGKREDDFREDQSKNSFNRLKSELEAKIALRRAFVESDQSMEAASEEWKAGKRAEITERALDEALENIKDHELSEKEIKEQNDKATQGFARNAASAWTVAFTSMADGSVSAGEAIKGAVISSAEAAVNAAAASGAAQAAFSQAGIPIIGPILAVAASGLMFGLIKAFLPKIAGAQTGGLITGGTPGVDSVPILAQQNERILNTSQTAKLDRFLDRGAGTTLVQQSIFPENTVDTHQKIRELDRLNSNRALMGLA